MVEPTARFPARSTAVKVIAWRPKPKLTGASLATPSLPSTMSVALTWERNDAIAGSEPERPLNRFVWTVADAGRCSAGGVVSRTVTGNDAVADTVRSSLL